MAAAEVVKSGSTRAQVTEVRINGTHLLRSTQVVPAQALRQLEDLPVAAAANSDSDEISLMSALLATLEDDPHPKIGLLVGDNLMSLTADASTVLRMLLEAAILSLSHDGMVRLRVSRDAEMLTPTQVAQQMGVSRPFIYKLLDRGDLPYEQVGRHRRVPADAVSEYLKAQHARVLLADDMAVEAARDGAKDVDLQAAARQSRLSGDPASLKNAMRTLRIERALRAQAAANEEQ
jgi:excisionase family DNA binding protein